MQSLVRLRAFYTRSLTIHLDIRLAIKCPKLKYQYDLM